MLDTVGGEIEKWIKAIKYDATRLKDYDLARHICELEYYFIALNCGININEDSGVAGRLINEENRDKVKDWQKNSCEFLKKNLELNS